jgi:acyl-CoA synthetase (NDP forming)
VLASAPPDHYQRALAAILRDDQVDSVIAIFILPLVTDPAAIAAAVASGARGSHGKPVVGVFMRADGAPGTLAPIPSYAFPESDAIALAPVTAHGTWRTKPVEPTPVLDRFERDEIRAIVERPLDRGGGWASAEEATGMLSAAGIESAASRVATTVEDAVQAASAIRYPVALKVLEPTLLHKTERRAVALGLADAHAVRGAHEDFTTRVGPDMTATLVQRMVPRGIEMIVGRFRIRSSVRSSHAGREGPWSTSWQTPPSVSIPRVRRTRAT